MKRFFLLSALALLMSHLHAQEIFIGKWTSQINHENSKTGINISLEVGNPEKSILYPAQLKISLDSFEATYQLLLVKKNMRQLAISTQKYAVAEKPFSLGNELSLLNGTFDYGKDSKGISSLELNRMFNKSKKNNGLKMPELKDYSKNHAALAQQLFSLFENGDINLKKTNNEPWLDSTTNKILQPKISPCYFGLIDTLFAKTKYGSVKFSGNKTSDIISIKINNNNIVDQIDSKKSRDNEDFILDTGLNIIVFYTDEFGKNAYSNATVEMQFDNLNRSLDFRETQNTAATFIVMKVFVQFDESSVTRFDSYSEDALNNKINSIPQGKNNNLSTSLNRPGKIIGSIVAKSQQITFAIWDDAVEDGDTISISINDKWITKNFPVLKKPQFITVTLTPGPNVITFVAENLGSIIPNTSVIEIIDGKKRKSFYIETDLNQNNLIKIFYDLKPE
jgi:hypothetical protein